MNIHREPYVAQELESGNIIEIEHENILDADPAANAPLTSTSLPFPHYPWIKHDAKVTIFLSNKMSSPKQGRLCLNNNE